MFNWCCFLFLGTLGWGGSLYLMKVLLVNLNPFEIVLYRIALGALTLSTMVFILRLRTGHWFYLLRDGLMVGIFNMIIPFYLVSYAQQMVSSSLAAILNGLTPLMTFVLGMFFFGTIKRWQTIQMISVLLGLVGIIIIQSAEVPVQGSSKAVLALLLASLSFALNANYVKTYAKIKEPLLLSAAAAWLALLILLFYQNCFLPMGTWNLPQSISQWFAIIWLGMVGSGVSLYLYCLLIQRAGATVASMITYVMALTGVTAGVVLLHETLSLKMGVGCVTILMALILINHASWFQRCLLFPQRLKQSLDSQE